MNIEFAEMEYRKYELTWDEARMYCFSLAIDGKVGWRLPTVDELYSTDWGIGGYEPSVWVWTSNADDDDVIAEQFDLSDGERWNLAKAESYDVWVYPVRDLKDD